MNEISILIIIMASISVYVGLYHLIMYIRRTKNKENLSFSFACFSVAIFDICCIGVYNAQSIAEGMYWQKFTFALSSLIAICYMWFILDLVNKKLNKIFYTFAIFFALIILIIFLYENELTFSLSSPMVRTVNIGSIIEITYNEVEPGLILSIHLIILLLAFIYFFIILIRSYRAGYKKILPIIISLLIFFLATFNDILITTANYSFIYVIEYSHMFIIFSMAYTLLNKFADLNIEVEELNINLEGKVEERTKELIEARDALWGEMQISKKIQTVLLPQKPTIKGYEIMVHMSPAAEVGGDYYDIINVVGRDWIIIGDVSGHGVSAGLIMMMVQTCIHNTLNIYPEIPPSELLTIVNKTITANIKLMGENKYMTITVLAAHENGKFVFAGLHQDIIVYRKKNGNVDLFKTNGTWIGLVDEVQDMMRDDNFELGVGDIMLVYTDGITEAWKKGSIKDNRDPETEMYGEERLIEIFSKLGKNSPEEIKNRIIQSLVDYECGSDDVTMVVVKKV